MRFLLHQTYCYPEQLQDSADLGGFSTKERIPDHPVRPARRTDASVWRVEISAADAIALVESGCNPIIDLHA